MRTTARGASAAAVLLLVGTGAAPPADATFPGRNGRVTFAEVTRHSAGPDTSDIWTAAPDGSRRVRLTTSGTAVEPAWSRSGLRIAYADAGRLMVMARSGRNKTLLAGAGWNSSPAWAPDGRRIVFVSERGQGEQLYVYDLDTQSVRQLTTKGGSNARAGEPVWSPRGDRIAFVRDTGGQSDLWTVRPDGTALTRVTDTTVVSELSPDWSPDGTRLVYHRYDGFTEGCVPGGIFTVRVADGRKTKVIDTACSDLDPRWSPDGRRILWQVLTGPAGGRARGAGLFTVRLSGTDRRTVVSGANRWFDPDWQRVR